MGAMGAGGGGGGRSRAGGYWQGAGWASCRPLMRLCVHCRASAGTRGVPCQHHGLSHHGMPGCIRNLPDMNEGEYPPPPL